MLVQARQAETAPKGGSLRLGIWNCRSGGYEGKGEGSELIDRPRLDRTKGIS